MNRKKFIKNTALALGGISVASVAGIRFSNKPSGQYEPYFKKLNESLKQYKRAIPCLLVDLNILDKNLEKLKQTLNNPSQFRIVVKSLPSIELILYVMQKTGSKKLMAFHQPFLSIFSEISDNSVDILMGKPMPVKTAAFYYEHFKAKNGFEPQKQLQWLVDTPKRVIEYIDLAKSKNLQLRLNVEIDVGLHRGGINNLKELSEALRLIEVNKNHVSFSGFMGYDAHIPKVPGILLSREKAYNNMREFYNDCKNLVKTKFPSLWSENLTFNGAGSPTIALHKRNDSPLNDISAGSFAVKPSDFDIDTLEQFSPASFIATPVLKKMENTTLPSLEGFKGLINLLDPNTQNSFYVYGGSWMATPFQPTGIKQNAFFGKSTNQVMLNASNQTNLNVDDFVFFRPHQSEFVFLQFGGILGVRNSKIVEEWKCMNFDLTETSS